MNIDRYFEIAIEEGKKGDARTEKEIQNDLDKRKKDYDNLDENKKDYFDKDRLTNIYLDSAIHYDSGKDIKKVFVGIDTEIQELLLAEKLDVDLVMGHHPEGKALLNLWEVLDIHQESLVKSGLPVNIAERLISDRQDELERGLHGQDYNRAVTAAKLLDISFLNIHTPADNLANKFMEDFLIKKDYDKLGDIIDGVLNISEYKETAKIGLEPKIVSGNEDNRVGKIFVKFNGGTSGNKKMFRHLENIGVSTFICMHLPKDQIEEAKKHNINVIVMPHMASDSLGMNLMIDAIESKEKTEFEIINGSGFIRIKRNK
ncbi:MAG: NGG1p interacting factor NIF3 [Fusobacteriota bacterium]